MDNLIWEATLDNIYHCSVARKGDYDGTLTIKKDDIVLYSRDVYLSYGATFGPDVVDIAEWEELIINYIDNKK